MKSQALSIIKGIFNGKSIIKDVGDVVDRFVTTKAEKEEAKRLIQEAIHQHEIKVKEQALEAERLLLEDRKDAREMQRAALEQADLFSKRYLYFLASFIIIGAFTFGIGLMFYDIPAANKRMVEMFADIFLFGSGVTVIQFFFGSSKSSTDKTTIMAKTSQKDT